MKREKESQRELAPKEQLEAILGNADEVQFGEALFRRHAFIDFIRIKKEADGKLVVRELLFGASRWLIMGKSGVIEEAYTDDGNRKTNYVPESWMRLLEEIMGRIPEYEKRVKGVDY